MATREAILTAAAHILVRDGYDRASTNRIAQRAGVSIGSLYQYYPSKEALVSALLERHVQTMLGLLATTAARMADAPLEDAVKAYVRAMLEVHRVDPKLHQVFFEQFPRLGGIARARAFQEQGMALVRAYLETHRPRLRRVDLNLAAFVLVHAVEGVTHAAVLDRAHELGRADLADEIAALVLRYLL